VALLSLLVMALLLNEGQEYGHSSNITFGTVHRRQSRGNRETMGGAAEDSWVS